MHPVDGSGPPDPPGPVVPAGPADPPVAAGGATGTPGGEASTSPAPEDLPSATAPTSTVPTSTGSTATGSATGEPAGPGAPDGPGAPPAPPGTPATPGVATLADAIGGWRGMVDSSVPSVVFITVYAILGLHAAVVASLVTAVVLAALRLLRREPVRYAVSGALGVAISAFIALRLGKAEGFFLPGILLNGLYGLAFLGSVLIGRPLLRYISQAFYPVAADDPDTRRALESAYRVTTLLWAGVSLSRMVVQGGLYLAGLPGWLAAARLGMGWPLTLGAVVVTVSVIRRAARLPEEPAAEIAEEILAGDAAHLTEPGRDGHLTEPGRDGQQTERGAPGHHTSAG